MLIVIHLTVSTQRNGSWTSASLGRSYVAGPSYWLYVVVVLSIGRSHVHLLFQTHHIAIVRGIAGYVVSVKDGRVVGQGPYEEVLKTDASLSKEVAEEEEDLRTADEETDSDVSQDENKIKSDGKLIVKEEIQEGLVSWAACMFVCISIQLAA